MSKKTTEAPTKLTPGLAIMLLGESGSGKSTFLRTALMEEGSGAVALAPGIDEWNSFSDLATLDPFAVRGFEPFSNDWRKALAWLSAVYKANKESLEATGELRYRVLGCDTYTGFDQLAVAALFNVQGLSEFPAAMSPEGAKFYSALRKYMEDLAAACRAIRGLGTHWIVTGHITEKSTDTSKGGVDADEVGTKQLMPIFRGGFREEARAGFDVVGFTEKKRVKRDGGVAMEYRIRWQSGNKMPTKSRLGALAGGAHLPNDYAVVKAAIEKAAERRMQEALERLKGK